jgi:hypothetical protein
LKTALEEMRASHAGRFDLDQLIDDEGSLTDRPGYISHEDLRILKSTNKLKCLRLAHGGHSMIEEIQASKAIADKFRACERPTVPGKKSTNQGGGAS